MRQRPKYSAARAFYISILLIFALAAWSIVTYRDIDLLEKESHRVIRRSHVLHNEHALEDASVTFKTVDLEASLADWVARSRLISATERLTSDQCHLVHASKDKCSFIRENCADEESGLFSYLQLYYCKLDRAKPVAFIILTLWLSLLFSTIGIAASDFFCINLSTIASILRMSESLTGVTFLAFGNGSSDVFSTFAAMKTHSGSLAIGELIGAAGFITAVVAGSMALVRPFKVAKKSFVRDVGFFIVAASFSMIFLVDGHLHLWESAVMVAFYAFYVITVVVWHWYLARKGHQREREAAARAHFHLPGTDEAEAEAYIDDDTDRATGGGRTPLRAPSGDDFANLERGESPVLFPMVEDADDQTRDHWMAEISSNMRVSRPRHGERQNTQNPIRPSLVGALEFRAVLSSLQKSRNIQSIPINLRRYSDDPAFTTAQQHDQISTASNPEINYPHTEDHGAISSSFLRPSMDAGRSNASRLRAVSANGVADLQLDPNPLQRPSLPEIDFLDATPPGTAKPNSSRNSGSGNGMGGVSTGLSTPRWSISLPPSEFGYLATSPAPISTLERTHSGDFLAPPGDIFPGFPDIHVSERERYTDEQELTDDTPKSNTSIQLPKIKIPRPSRTQGSSPSSQFPAYHDDPTFLRSSRTPSLLLPPPSIGSESSFPRSAFNHSEDKPVRWWPYKVLPAPQILISTLFPTLYAWRDKSIWERLLGIVAAPSVLLLTITLPVVEIEKEESFPDPDRGFLTPTDVRSRSQTQSITNPQLPPESLSSDYETNEQRDSKSSFQFLSSHDRDGANPADIRNPPEPSSAVAIKVTDGQPPSNPLRTRQDSTRLLPKPPQSDYTTPSSSKEWNRWLVVTQVFTAPFFIVIVYWANNDPDLSRRNLLLGTLYGLIISLALFALLLLTTTVSRPPRHRYLFCFLGFVVSVAWISTIANEVVGVLKAFGVILGISDAILGLTIFAVGNSLGDLVADITVARLGYPVMALSACFGGPMLNILLGIGLSGLYMTIKAGNGRHERHPNKPLKYKPYSIEIGETLIISGIMLLVTLLGLLIAVPLNRWRMDRKIGWGLVALWCASTVGNVAVEVMGWGQNIKSLVKK